MSAENLCAGLEIGNIEALQPLHYMMDLQTVLQARLNKIPAEHTPIADRILEVIYWRHCIHSECDELLEWFDKPAFNFKEVEMEAIDILHFVLNIGIVLGLKAEEVQSHVGPYLDQYPVSTTTSKVACQMLICDLSSTITKLVDLLPWKSWKDYTKATPVSRVILLTAYAEVVKANLILATNLGMNTCRVINIFTAKNKENHARQDRGY